MAAKGARVALIDIRSAPGFDAIEETVTVRVVVARVGSGFELLQVEPSANDGPHVAMPTAYLAVEIGDHLLPDGSRLLAFEYSTNSFANRFVSTTWDTRTFPSAFSAPPAVIAAIQTMNNESGTPPSTASSPFMDVGIRNVTTGSLQVTLERAESTAGTVSSTERIGLLAADSGFSLSFVDQFGAAIDLQSLATPANVQGWDNGCFSNAFPVPFSAAPLAVASANTRNGNNGGWVRRCSISSSTLGLTIDEDVDNESERSLRDSTQARKTGRTSKTVRGARRRTIVTSVLESLGVCLPKFTLSTVVNEATNWLAAGRSHFQALATARGLRLSDPSILDTLLPGPAG